LISISAFGDSETAILEFSSENNVVGFFTFEFTRANNGLPAMLIGYYSFKDILVFMPEFYIEQEFCSAKYDILGIDGGVIKVIEPGWYELGDRVPAKQQIIMYVMLPVNFQFDEDVTVTFETANDIAWHLYSPANYSSDELSYWRNGKRYNF
jgi:hypothetical protein